VSDPTKSPFPLEEAVKKSVIIDLQTTTFFLLNTAIYLWFREQDVISEHLLAASALDVLNKVGKDNGVQSHVFSEEMQKLVGKKLRLAMNFFKHGPDSHGKRAKIDPGAALKFSPVATELFLIDGLQMYEKIYGSLSPLMDTFRAWFLINRGREFVPLVDSEKLLPEGTSIEDLVELSRLEFMQEILPAYIEMINTDLEG
jgi:hypothetical protein